MLPQNVGVSTKGRDPIVGLGKVEADLVLILQGFGPDKGQFPSGPKAHPDGNVLVLGPLGIEGGRIVMKGLPVGGILVPVEAGPDGFLANGKVLAQSIDDSLKGRTRSRILANQMGAFVPGTPLGVLGPSGLDLPEFLDQLIVHGPIVFGTKELGNNDDIVVLERLVVFGNPIGAQLNP